MLGGLARKGLARGGLARGGLARGTMWSLAVIALGGCLPADAPATKPAPPNPDTPVFRDWKIIDHVLGADALISELDAAGFHGRTVVVAPTHFSSPWSGSCDDPHWTRTPRTRADVMRRYKLADRADLALVTDIVEFALSCGPDDGSSRVPPLSLFVAADHAVTCWSGVCYLLAP